MTGQDPSTSTYGSESMLNNRSAWCQIVFHITQIPVKETKYLNMFKMSAADLRRTKNSWTLSGIICVKEPQTQGLMNLYKTYKN